MFQSLLLKGGGGKSVLSVCSSFVQSGLSAAVLCREFSIAVITVFDGQTRLSFPVGTMLGRIGREAQGRTPRSFPISITLG